MKKKVQIGWDDVLQTYRQLNKGETVVGTIIVPAKLDLSKLYKKQKEIKI